LVVSIHYREQFWVLLVNGSSKYKLFHHVSEVVEWWHTIRDLLQLLLSRFVSKSHSFVLLQTFPLIKWISLNYHIAEAPWWCQ
jgi:uncharacterized membrane protein